MKKKGAEPLRVAIIGGGSAAMAAAFELSSPRQRGRFDITVYQQGFRLGGKGASGRGPFGRIEEHGMHFWMGFYDNAFRVLRECYEELDRDPEACPIARWDEALSPAPTVAMMPQAPDGTWVPRVLDYPVLPGLPGDPIEDSDLFTMRGYLVRAAEMVLAFLQAALGRAEKSRRRAAQSPRRGRFRSRARMSQRRLTRLVNGLITGPALLTAGAIRQASEALCDVLALATENIPLTGVLARAPMALLDLLSQVVEREIDRTLDPSDEIGWLLTAADVFLAAMRGILKHGIIDDPRGLDAIDDLDFREFLRQNGATRASLRSALVRGGVYDLTFAYDFGHPDAPSFGAGSAIRSLFRMFLTYRGGFYWRMNAGMGDVVFAPLYEVLTSKHRNVKIKFFHRLRNIALTPESEVSPGEEPLVEELLFDVQARTKEDKEYSPLIDVHGLPCWPSEPLWDQLDLGKSTEESARPDFESHWDTSCIRQERLVRGEDFDLVILAVGLGAIPFVAKELVERSPRYERMVKHVKTVATQALQLWMDPSTDELGWPHEATAFIGFAKPFESWADMSHVAEMEQWKKPRPRSVHYFVGALPEPDDPADFDSPGYAERRRLDVLENAERALSRDFGGIWPNTVNRSGHFRWDLLHVESETTGKKRLGEQYFRANVNPSDRYTLAVPGSFRHRISPLEIDFGNLTVAGDWTSGTLGTGNVESAVMSGLLASHALSGLPRLEEIVGFDHP